MLTVPADPRAALAALCERGLDWRTDPSRNVADVSEARRAAVLVLFGALGVTPARTDTDTDTTMSVPDELDVLLLRRAMTLGSHPGQIAFPGGRFESSDTGPEAAAVREAVEETGLDAQGLELLGSLPALPIAVSNHLVTPVLSWWTRPSTVVAVDHGETVEVFRTPVAELLDPANRAMTVHLVGRRSYRAPAFTVDGKLIWGFTAIVLSRLFDELAWAVPWDSGRIVRPEIQ